MTLEETRNYAWIGDAVLALFARRWILKQSNIRSKSEPMLLRL
jgi:23S rRNA maturation mini-RNase III